MYLSERAPGARLTTLLALVLAVLSTVLIAMRVEQVLQELSQSRSLRMAQQVRAHVESGFRVGLSLADQTSLDAFLKRQQEQDPSLMAATVQSDRGEVVASVGDVQALGRINPLWSKQLLGQRDQAAASAEFMERSLETLGVVGVVLLDSAGNRAGVAWLVNDWSALRASGAELLRAMWPFTLLAAAVLIVLLGIAVSWWVRQTARRWDVVQSVVLQGGLNGSAAISSTEPFGMETLARQADTAAGGSRGEWRDLAWLCTAFIVVFATLSGLAWQARLFAQPLLVTEIDKNAATVETMVRSDLERALRLGIPLRGLEGLNALFEEALKPAPEVVFIALRDPSQAGADQWLAIQTRDSKQNGSLQALEEWEKSPGNADVGSFHLVASDVVDGAGRPLAQLVVASSLDVVGQRLNAILLDLLFAVVVSLVLVREVLGGLLQRSVLKPLVEFEATWPVWRDRALALGKESLQASQEWLAGVVAWLQEIGAALLRGEEGVSSVVGRELVRLRLIVFFTALSEELMRPFFSVFASEVKPLAAGLSPTMLAGLPVMTFMFTLALAQPLGPWVTRRFDIRRALFVVAMVGAALLGMTAFTQEGLALALLRAGSGVTYGLLLILTQTTVVRITSSDRRARGLMELSAAIVAAGVCGPALGGLVEERFGVWLAFGACAACLVLAGLFSLRMAPLPRQRHDQLAGLGGARGLMAVLRHPQVMAVTWYAAVPARLVAAALLVVVTPLYLLELGETASASGRVLLLYFLAFMMVAPWVASRSDRSRSRRPWVMVGSALSALACAALPVIGGLWGAAVCCALLGVAQALLSAPQLALVTEAFDPQAVAQAQATPEQALAAFRFIERVGSIVAPLVVALAVARWGLTGAVGALGVLLAVCTLALGLAFRRSEPLQALSHS
jgi:MFS family permease